jgi:hypothetical protein
MTQLSVAALLKVPLDGGALIGSGVTILWLEVKTALVSLAFK